MQEIHSTCQGESHKATNKVCQDYSYVEITNDLTIAVVCDGHGGERYFRSDIGSKVAAEVTAECMRLFIEGIDKNIFLGKPFTQHNALSTEVKNNDYHKGTEVEKVMRQLFSSIIYNWREKILSHAIANPLTENEVAVVPQKAQQEFANNVGHEKTYGCTLMCYVQTADYWLAFHIGDGKCIAFDEEGRWSEPIPWDDKCFLNKTTSLCDSSAIDEFRFCYAGDGSFPLSVFLGSDGIDDSFGETPNMINFYVQILKTIAKSSVEEAKASIEEALPELSKIGSKDDMSVVCVFDENRLSDVVPQLIGWQRNNIKEQIDAINSKLQSLYEKKKIIEDKQIKEKKDKIDFDYTVKDIDRSFKIKESLISKYDKFSRELSPESFVPYSDDIRPENKDLEESTNDITEQQPVPYKEEE